MLAPLTPGCIWHCLLQALSELTALTALRIRGACSAVPCTALALLLHAQPDSPKLLPVLAPLRRLRRLLLPRSVAVEAGGAGLQHLRSFPCAQLLTAAYLLHCKRACRTQSWVPGFIYEDVQASLNHVETQVRYEHCGDAMALSRQPTVCSGLLTSRARLRASWLL